MSATVTYDQIEQDADRALAYALLVRLAKSYVTSIYRLREVAEPLEGLVSDLTPERVQQLAADETEIAVRLRGRLEQLQAVLGRFAGSEEASRMKKIPVISGFVSKIQYSTEDLQDIVENIGLARNADFKNLVSCCASSLGFSQSEDVGGDMHDKLGSKSTVS